jgi:hypothetical protein
VALQLLPLDGSRNGRRVQGVSHPRRSWRVSRGTTRG